MANPNIVSVSSIYGESQGAVLSTNLSTIIHTVIADKLVKLNSITIANWHATTSVAVTVSISKADFTSVGDSVADAAATYDLCQATVVAATDVLQVLDFPIYLMEGDNIRAGATVATCDIIWSYEVINDA